jgi:glutamate-5-semialdehyde dehydrogenase
VKAMITALKAQGKAAHEASRQMGYLSTDKKNQALHNIADDLLSRQAEIIAANRLDYEAGKKAQMSVALLDRLLLDEGRIQAIAADVRTVAGIVDPVGEVYEMRTMPNGLQIGRKRIPLGVIGAIYESRPNVTVDIAALCIKSGNSVILRGGRDAINSNTILSLIVAEAIARAGIPDGAVQFVANTDRALVDHMLALSEYISLLIPRGGAGLIRYVAENAAVPVLTGGIGVCHTYVDKAGDIDKAVAIAFNAKVQRPTVCNALDTLLVHEDIAAACLPKIAVAWAEAGVEMHCDEASLEILSPNKSLKVSAATDEDWGKEFLALVAAVKIVPSLDEAINHIAVYGSGHSEAIISEDYGAVMRFLNEVDAAAVYANASTRFTDGSQFGLGAEVGISTQKMHARGPLGLKELTTYKWIIFGNGQVRP